MMVNLELLFTIDDALGKKMPTELVRIIAGYAMPPMKEVMVELVEYCEHKQLIVPEFVYKQANEMLRAIDNEKLKSLKWKLLHKLFQYTLVEMKYLLETNQVLTSALKSKLVDFYYFGRQLNLTFIHRSFTGEYIQESPDMKEYIRMSRDNFGVRSKVKFT